MNRVKQIVRKLWSNVMVRRTVHTFWQAFLAVFLAGLPLITSTFNVHNVKMAEAALISLITAAVAAGLAAIRTGIMNIYQARQGV